MYIGVVFWASPYWFKLLLTVWMVWPSTFSHLVVLRYQCIGHLWLMVCLKFFYQLWTGTLERKNQQMVIFMKFIFFLIPSFSFHMYQSEQLIGALGDFQIRIVAFTTTSWWVCKVSIGQLALYAHAHELIRKKWMLIVDKPIFLEKSIVILEWHLIICFFKRW